MALSDRGMFAFSTESFEVEEGDDGATCCLSQAGRYRHSDSHMRRLGSLYKLDLAMTELCIGRQEAGEPVHHDDNAIHLPAAGGIST